MKFRFPPLSLRDENLQKLRDENLQKLDEFLPNKSSSVYDTRGNCKYNNYYCKTERFRKSFLPQIISKLNCE